MEKMIIDECTGWEYELKGEKYYPTGRVQKNGVMTPGTIESDNEPDEEYTIGVWGQRHAAFLKKHQRSVYDEFFFSGRLNTYLTQIDHDAQEMFDLLVRQISAQKDLTEQLKTKNQMEWVQRSNSIFNQAVEVVNRELIFV